MDFGGCNLTGSCPAELAGAELLSKGIVHALVMRNSQEFQFGVWVQIAGSPKNCVSSPGACPPADSPHVQRDAESQCPQESMRR